MKSQSMPSPSPSLLLSFSPSLLALPSPLIIGRKGKRKYTAENEVEQVGINIVYEEGYSGDVPSAYSEKSKEKELKGATVNIKNTNGEEEREGRREERDE
jgi:hypothetical protein